MGTENLNTKRIAWIDIAKCFGIFYVVLGHTFVELNLIQEVLYLFHVPLFFFLSGLTYHYDKNQKRFILNKIKRLYLPYLFVALISIVVYLLLGTLVGSGVSLSLDSFLQCLYGMIYGNVSAGNMMWNRPLWFLLALLMVLIITNLLEAIPNKPLRYICVCGLCILGYWLSAMRIFLPLQTETALSMLVWIYLGYLLKDSLIQIGNSSKLWMGIFAIIPIAALGLWLGFYNGTISVMVDLYGKFVPFYIISAFCLSLVTVYISMLIHKSQVLEYVGKNTLPILLWHKFPIEFCQGICPFVKDWLISPNIWIVDITTLAVSLVAIILSIIVHEIIMFFYKRFIPA